MQLSPTGLEEGVPVLQPRTCGFFNIGNNISPFLLSQCRPFYQGRSPRRAIANWCPSWWNVAKSEKAWVLKGSRLYIREFCELVRIYFFSVCRYFYLGCTLVLNIALVPDQGRERQFLFFQFHKTPHSDDGLVDDAWKNVDREKKCGKCSRIKATSYSQRKKNQQTIYTWFFFNLKQIGTTDNFFIAYD